MGANSRSPGRVHDGKGGKGGAELYMCLYRIMFEELHRHLERIFKSQCLCGCYKASKKKNEDLTVRCRMVSDQFHIQKRANLLFYMRNHGALRNILR